MDSSRCDGHLCVSVCPSWNRVYQGIDGLGSAPPWLSLRYASHGGPHGGGPCRFIWVPHGCSPVGSFPWETPLGHTVELYIRARSSVVFFLLPLILWIHAISLTMAALGKIPIDNLIIAPIMEGYLFWSLYDELVKSQSEIVRNRAILVDAFRRNEMFGIKIYYRGHENPLEQFCMPKTHWLPTFCTIDNHDKMCTLLWVQPTLRRKGLGSFYVKHFGWKEVDEVLPVSVEFWKKNDVEIHRMV